MDPILMLFRQVPPEGWAWTLDPAQTAWSRRNALAMSLGALLAYSDGERIDAQLKARGFSAVDPCNSDHHAADTQAYLGVRPDALVLAFRGTEPSNLADFATDFDARQVPFEAKFGLTGWGRVHEGWADGVAVVLPKLMQLLAKHPGGGRPLWITGHSLGGALAMVAAAILSGVPGVPIGGVYTFGQPRVGDPGFRARYDGALGHLTFRCVNDRDLVPHVPPRRLSRFEQMLIQPGAPSLSALAAALAGGPAADELYEHAGQLRLLLAGGGFSDRAADESAREPPFLAGPRTARSLVFGLPALLAESIDRLKDHAPINPADGDGYTERIAALG